MRRRGNISKRCMVCIMSAMMMMSSVTVSMAFPVGVYAGEVYETTFEMPIYGHDDYLDEDTYRVEPGDTLKLNNEDLEKNSGTVKVNESYIAENAGTVETNNGRVNQSSGEVTENNNTVNTNTGIIVTNGANGIVTNNINTVTTNYGTVYNSNVSQGIGTVVNNFGTVNSSTIGGNVTNNYGGTVSTTTVVANQFWAVSCDMLATPEFGSDFVSSPDENDTNNYIQVTSNGSAIVTTGTVTISTDSEHEIEAQDQTNATGTYDTASFTYSLTRQGNGKIIVTISALNGNICLTEDSLGILIKEIQKQNENVAIDEFVVQDSDDNNNGNGNGDPASSSQGETVEQSLINMINKKMDTSADAVDIDFKKDTYVTKDMLKALIKDNSKDVYCKFICDDVIYILRIPKGHKLTADIIESIFANQKDTAGAGFLTIQKLFANYGLQVEPEDNKLYKAVSIKSGASAQADAGIVRGREVYDPKTNTWNWLDANANGAKARDKEVWIPYIYQDEIDWYDDDAKMREMAALSDKGMEEVVYDAMKNKKGKWLRYGADGKVLKGWVTIEGDLADIYPDQAGNTYYYDTVTGTMAKGVVTLNGVKYSFNEITGALEK